MRTKILNPDLALINLMPHLRGNVQEGGWITLHNSSFEGQRTSIIALGKLHAMGYSFDIETNDGKLLENVTINDARVKLEYNVGSNIETVPANGIQCWRLSSIQSSYLPLPVSVVVDYKTPNGDWAVPPEAIAQALSDSPLTQENLYKARSQPDFGPFYANDKYKREIKPGVFIDVYDVIDCFEVTSGALQHAVKKLLAAGKRGHKDYEQDLIDILSSVERALFQHQEKHK